MTGDQFHDSDAAKMRDHADFETLARFWPDRNQVGVNREGIDPYKPASIDGRTQSDASQFFRVLCLIIKAICGIRMRAMRP